MNHAKVIEALTEVSALKSRLRFPIIDTHVHPFDVMGIAPPRSAVYRADRQKKNVVSAGLLEMFKYDRVAKLGTAAAFFFMPQLVRRMIFSTYEGLNPRKLREIADAALVDKMCLLPIAPWVTADDIGSMYTDRSRFFILGSLDVHQTDPDDIASLLHNWQQRFSIIGLKLHPNLQGFSPQPSKNPPRVRELLKRIYAEAENRKLYLHFHAGRSFYTQHVDPVYGKPPRSSNQGILNNFFSDGTSEIFGRYNIPIVIAHVASYGLNDLDCDALKDAVRLHKRIFFDTSGVSPRLIKSALSTVGPSHIVFGSDSPYNSMAFNVAFLWKAITESHIERVEDAAAAIFGLNFEQKIRATR